MKKKFVITIDGPAGAGKSTISKILASKLDYIYLDTGALYRGMAYKAVKFKISLNDVSALSDLCSNTNVSLKSLGNRMKVFVDNEDVGEKIRTEEIGMAASKISTYSIVREKLLDLQRKAGDEGGIVAEGRDMGSVVFPDADFKFYLDANLEERIKRRYEELLSNGVNVDYEVIQKDMSLRDAQDKGREIAPLRIPKGAIIIDSNNLSIGEVVKKMMANIQVKIDFK